jgi:O-antigen/teichoic acid export membrane protein
VVTHPLGRHRRPRRRRRWVAKGLWAVTDQGLFALTNFMVSALLARWLTQSSYGAFAVALSVLLLMGTIHGALLTEPMLILGPSRYQDGTATYIRRLTLLHVVLTSGMSVILLLVVLTLNVVQRQFGTATTLIAAALAAPAVLFLWLMRRACYMESRPRLAATAGLAYAVVVPASMLLFAKTGFLTAASGLMALGISSFLVAWWLKLRLTHSSSARTTIISSKSVVHAHWTYGRWALGSALFSWVPANAVVLALPLWHSLDNAGTLRVATTLILPIQHLQAALALLILPTLVRTRFTGQLRSRATLVRVLFVSSSFVYAPLVLTFGTEFAQLFFGTQYQLHGMTLWLLAAIPLATAVSAVSGAILRVLERPDQVLWTYVAATTVTCLVGLPLVYHFSVDGALASMLLSTVTTAILATYAGRRLMGDTNTIKVGRVDRRLLSSETQDDKRTPCGAVPSS